MHRFVFSPLPPPLHFRRESLLPSLRSSSSVVEELRKKYGSRFPNLREYEVRFESIKFDDSLTLWISNFTIFVHIRSLAISFSFSSYLISFIWVGGASFFITDSYRLSPLLFYSKLAFSNRYERCRVVSQVRRQETKAQLEFLFYSIWLEKKKKFDLQWRQE